MSKKNKKNKKNKFNPIYEMLKKEEEAEKEDMIKEKKMKAGKKPAEKETKETTEDTDKHEKAGGDPVLDHEKENKQKAATINKVTTAKKEAAQKLDLGDKKEKKIVKTRPKAKVANSTNVVHSSKPDVDDFLNNVGMLLKHVSIM